MRVARSVPIAVASRFEVLATPRECGAFLFLVGSISFLVKPGGYNVARRLPLARLAQIMIMSIRVIALLSIILGIILFLGKSENPQNYIAAHFAFGFLLAAAVFILGVIAIVQKFVPVGVVAIVAAIALPLTGFRQISTLGPNMGIPQILHIIVVFAAIGVAEAGAAKIKRAG